MAFTFHKVLVRKVKNPNFPPEVYEMAHFGETGSAQSGTSFHSDQGVGSNGAADVGHRSAMTPKAGMRSRRAAKSRGRNKMVHVQAGDGGVGRADRVGGNTSDSAVRSGRRAGVKTASTKRRFTLQVSSFRSRKEAGSMVHKLKSKGFKPYVITSYIPKRGMWYRVRVGAFGSWGTAMYAKKRFEKEWRMTAYVTRMH